jgi:hypothetical protein
MGSINQAQRQIVTVRVMNQQRTRTTINRSDLEIYVACLAAFAGKPGSHRVCVDHSKVFQPGKSGSEACPQRRSRDHP